MYWKKKGNPIRSQIDAENHFLHIPLFFSPCSRSLFMLTRTRLEKRFLVWRYQKINFLFWTKTKEIFFRWFVLCAWQRNYGHLLCGPLNQARRRCKYFVTQVWTWSFPVCIFCEVRTFCQFNVTDTGQHFPCLCCRVLQQCPSIRVEYVREIYQHGRVGLGGIWAQRGPCRSNTVYWCSQDPATPLPMSSTMPILF